MEIKSVNLYEALNLQAPEGAAGQLTCYISHTHPSISPTRRRPAVLILPGGGYVYTSAREAEPIALRFAVKGYCAYVLDYSCKPHCFPTLLREAVMAMRYIRENADAMEVDPHMVAAVGFSAGGHLCGLLGTMYDAPEVADIGDAALLRPDALGLCYPVTVSWGRTHTGSFENISGGEEALVKRLSLDALARPDMPPVFLWHTRDDATVPCRNSIVMAQALEEAGVEFALHIYRKGKHGLSTADALVYPEGGIPEMSWDAASWLEAQIQFFAECGLQLHD